MCAYCLLLKIASINILSCFTASNNYLPKLPHVSQSLPYPKLATRKVQGSKNFDNKWQLSSTQ